MFVTAGSSWGETPTTLGDAGGVVTWSIAGAGHDITAFPGTSGRSVDPDSFLTINYLGIIRQAFTDWSEVGNIEFMQIEDPSGDPGTQTDPDIRIFFGSIPSNTIGWAFFPPSNAFGSGIAGDILLDNLRSFNTNIEQFTGLVLHEIGHALGLEHVPNGSPSVMTPNIRLSSLTEADKDGIRAIYGEQDNAPPVYTMRNDRQDINILQSPKDIIVNGNDMDNRIDGTSNGETFAGKSGDDHLLGRGGNDRLGGGRGDDRINGGPGADRGVGQAGDDTLNGGSGADNLKGGGGEDALNGDSGSDFLKGGTSRDVVNGGKGADRAFGNAGADNLNGGAGRDRLNGGGQDDRLNGGDGNDVLKGGRGSDVFVFKSGNGNDRILDFSTKDSDEKIDLSDVRGIRNLTDLRNNHMTQDGNDVVIDTGGGNSIRVEDVSLSDLDGSDFIF